MAAAKYIRNGWDTRKQLDTIHQLEQQARHNATRTDICHDGRSAAQHAQDALRWLLAELARMDAMFQYATYQYIHNRKPAPAVSVYNPHNFTRIIGKLEACNDCWGNGAVMKPTRQQARALVALYKAPERKAA